MQAMMYSYDWDIACSAILFFRLFLDTIEILCLVYSNFCLKLNIV